MMDLDCVEYDGDGNTLALVETKYGLVQDIDLNDIQFTVLCKMAREEIPVFCLVYYPMDEHGNLVDANEPYENMKHIQYYVVPVNRCAKRIVPKQTKMTEIEWVMILANIHGNTIPDRSKYGYHWKQVKNIPMIFPRV